MKIKTIGRTISFGQYENISMQAELNQRDNISKCLLKLENKIKDEIDKRQGYKTSRFEIQRLENDSNKLKDEIKLMEEKKLKLQKWARNHKIKLSVFDDLPF